MKNFSINMISSRPEIIYGLPTYWGRIRIGSFQEKFISPINIWSVDDYKTQWVQGLNRILLEKESCLITSMQDIDIDPFVNLWVLYREESIVFVQNHMLVGDYFREIVKGPFNSDTCYFYIQPRETVTDDGDRISEWSFELD